MKIMRIKKIDEVVVIGTDADKFEELLKYYNTEVTPDNPYTESELVCQLLREAVRSDYYNKIWKE